MSIGRTSKVLFSSSLITAVMFALAWSESVSAYAPGDDDSSGQDDYVEENTGDSQNYLLRNDQGSEVDQLQSDLSESGHTVQVDGIFGPETENAVKAYQSDQGLDIDGVAGPNTYDALSSDESSSEDASTPDDSSNGDESASEGSDNGDSSNEESENQDPSSDSGLWQPLKVSWEHLMFGAVQHRTDLIAAALSTTCMIKMASMFPEPMKQCGITMGNT